MKNLSGKKPAPASTKKPSEGVIVESLSGRLKGKVSYDSSQGEWRVYSNGMWEKAKEISIRESIRKTIHSEFTTDYSLNFVKGVQGLLMGCLGVDSWDKGIDSVPFKNGVLNIRTREFLTHSPENLFTWQLPYEYNPLATCQPILDWLAETCEHDNSTIELIQAFFHAVLTGRSDLQRFLEIDGPGGTGKGTLLRLLVDMLGERNVYSTELDHLEKNRFETAALQGKRLVMLTDAKDYGGDGNVLKALTGQDWLRKEKKNKQQEEPFIFSGLVVIAANKPVTFKDLSSAIPRRRVSINFSKVVPIHKKRDLLEEFKPFISGLLNWALAISMERVVELLRDSEKHCKPSATAKKQTLIESNSIIAWLDAGVEFCDGCKVKVGSLSTGTDKFQDADNWLFPNYARYCVEVGKKSVGQQTFSRELEDALMNTLALGQGFKKQDGRLNSTLMGAHFIGLKIAREPSYSIVDYAFNPNPIVTTTAPEKLIVAALAVIDEKCQYNWNGVELDKLKSQLNRSHGIYNDILEVADSFADSFVMAKRNGLDDSIAFSKALEVFAV